ncbi:copper/zinc superoxide dismutase 2 [Striga asiatica]|uniref:Copper/zinc superoxide dismutase 2 n=1 Tax=Striga asiatica TaxID=4170 RepID=A0A5A7Q1V4_STRAF|nr:copper/zinc superoxide dismutase 2 [Striga asiatica]
MLEGSYQALFAVLTGNRKQGKRSRKYLPKGRRGSLSVCFFLKLPPIRPEVQGKTRASLVFRDRTDSLFLLSFTTIHRASAQSYLPFLFLGSWFFGFLAFSLFVLSFVAMVKKGLKLPRVRRQPMHTNVSGHEFIQSRGKGYCFVVLVVRIVVRRSPGEVISTRKDLTFGARRDPIRDGQVSGVRAHLYEKGSSLGPGNRMIGAFISQVVLDEERSSERTATLHAFEELLFFGQDFDIRRNSPKEDEYACIHIGDGKKIWARTSGKETTTRQRHEEVLTGPLAAKRPSFGIPLRFFRSYLGHQLSLSTQLRSLPCLH